MYVIECECGRQLRTVESEVTCPQCQRALSIHGWGDQPPSVEDALKIILNAPSEGNATDRKPDHD